MEKLSKFTRKILYNNKILAVICFVLAVIIWLVVTVELSPETTVTITDIPVTVDYASINTSLGLTPFGESDFKVDVTVTGRRLVVESDDFKDSISVVANTSSVTGAGTYSLRLDVSYSGSNSDVTLNSISSSNITVYFDYEAQEEFAVEPVITNEGSFVPAGYVTGDAFVSAKQVLVTGPESELRKITGLEARVQIEGEVTETQVVNTDITAVTTSSVNFNYITFRKSQSSVELSSVDVTVPIYKEVTLGTSVSFTGRPSLYSESASFSYTVSPSSVKLGIPQSRIESMTALTVKKIDFSTLWPGENKFEIEASEIENNGCVILDGTEKFTVIVKAADVKTVVLEAPEKIDCINLPEGITVESVQPDFPGVTIAGSSDKVADIRLDETNFHADLSSVKAGDSGEVTVPVVFNDDNCWAVGEFTATVTIS